MAIRRMNYLEIPQKARRKAANQMLEQVKRGLQNPGLTESERSRALATVGRLTDWANGRLPVHNHDVQLEEHVGLKES